MRRVIDVVLVVTVLAAAFFVWIGGLAFAGAGLALDHPLCLESERSCESAWSWAPPGRHYEWVEIDGGTRSGTEPWESMGTDSWAWTTIVAVFAVVGTVAVLRRGRPSLLTRRRQRLELPLVRRPGE